MKTFLAAVVTVALACKGGGSTTSSPTATGSGTAAPGGFDAAAAPVDAAAAPVEPAFVVDAAVAVDAAASTAVPTPPGAPRVVLIHGPELLGSEQKALDRLRAGLARGRNSAMLVDAAPDEEAVARAWFDGVAPTTPPPLPPAWGAAPVVLVLELRPPYGEKPKRMSGGLGGWIAFRPPSFEPVIVQRGLGAGGDLGEGAAQAVLDTLALAAGATP